MIFQRWLKNSPQEQLLIFIAAPPSEVSKKVKTLTQSFALKKPKFYGRFYACI